MGETSKGATGFQEGAQSKNSKHVEESRSTLHIAFRGFGGAFRSHGFCDKYVFANFIAHADECISCGEAPDLYCAEYDSSRCQKCDQLWHSHRLRRYHVLSVSLECQLSM